MKHEDSFQGAEVQYRLWPDELTEDEGGEDEAKGHASNETPEQVAGALAGELSDGVQYRLWPDELTEDEGGEDEAKGHASNEAPEQVAGVYEASAGELSNGEEEEVPGLYAPKILEGQHEQQGKGTQYRLSAGNLTEDEGDVDEAGGRASNETTPARAASGSPEDEEEKMEALEASGIHEGTHGPQVGSNQSDSHAASAGKPILGIGVDSHEKEEAMMSMEPRELIFEKTNPMETISKMDSKITSAGKKSPVEAYEGVAGSIGLAALPREDVRVTTTTPKKSSHAVYIPHDVVVEECIKRIKNVEKEEQPQLQVLESRWKLLHDTAQTALKEFIAEKQKIQGEIDTLRLNVEVMMNMTSSYDTAEPRLKHEDHINIIKDARRLIQTYDETIGDLQDEVKKWGDRMEASINIEEHGIAQNKLLGLKQRLHDAENKAHKEYESRVELLRLNRISELKKERNTGEKQRGMERYQRLFDVHQRNQRTFSETVDAMTLDLTKNLNKTEVHYNEVLNIKSRYKEARKKMDSVGRDLCRASELLIVPHSTEGEYDSVVAQIMRKHGPIEEPPDFDGDWENACQRVEGDKEKVITPNLYQILPAYFASSNNGDNLLVYHDMGTGKTCTIVLMVLQMAVHQYNDRLGEKKVDSATGCLILVQKASAIPKFTAELRTCGLAMLNNFQKNTGVWCNIDGANKGPDEEKIPGFTGPAIHKWSFYHTTHANEKPFFVATFQSITLKYDPPKDVKRNLIGGNKNDTGLPTYVIVDEAHNLYDPSGLGATETGRKRVAKYAEQFEKQMHAIPANRSKIIFLTGTPTTGSMTALVSLLSLLGPSVREAMQIPSKKNISADAAEQELLNKYFVETPRKRMVRKQKEVKNVMPYRWNKNQEATIGEALKGKISYVTMANDPRVFAQFGIYLRVPISPVSGKPNALITLVPERKSQEENLYAASGAILTQSEAGDTFDLDEKSLKSGTKYVLVKTRPQRSHEFKSANDLKTFKFFVPYIVKNKEEDEILPAWKAVFSLVSHNVFLPGQSEVRFKHFFYYDKDSRNETKGFENAFIRKFYPDGDKKGMNKYRDKYEIPFFGDVVKKVTDSDCRPEALEKLIKAVNEFKEKYKGPLAVYLRKPKPADGEVEKAAEKYNANLITMFECVYNSEQNKDGSLIQYVFVSKDFKEGLSLYGTRFVHVLSPPRTERALQQAVRRALRYCGMVYVDDPRNNWFITVLLYCADYEQLQESAREKIEKLDPTEQGNVLDEKRCEKISKMQIMPGTDPVDMFLQMLKEYAVDCKTLTPVNKVKCAGKSSEPEKSEGCGQLWKHNGEWKRSPNHKNCDQDLRLPSPEDETSTSMRDEILRMLLENSSASESWDNERISAPKTTSGFSLYHNEAPLTLFEKLMDTDDSHQLANAVRIFLNERYQKAKDKMSPARLKQLSQQASTTADAFHGLKTVGHSIAHKFDETVYDSQPVVNHSNLTELRNDAMSKNLLPKN